MKTTLLALLTLIGIAFISCKPEVKNVDDPTNANDTDSTKTPKETPKPEIEPVVEKSITYGIDISKYQGDEMDLMKKATDSLSFIICRSTEGVTYTDAKFKSNWNTAKEKGYIRGAYHFYLSDDSPENQSANFLKAIEDLQDSDLPPIIDFEEMSIAKGSNKEKVIEDLWKFIFIIQEKSGRTPIIYTDLNIGDTYLTAARFANYPLWVADYNSGVKPTLPGAWKGMEWVMWQSTDDYHFGKIQDDFDRFNGSLADLKKFISGSILK